MPPLINRQILAPVIGIAFEYDATRQINFIDHIGTRARRPFNPVLVELLTSLLEPFLRPCRHPAHLFDQATAGHTVSKIELDGVVIDDFDLGDQLANKISVGLQPLIEQQVMAEGNVMGCHRSAIRETRLRPHAEDDPAFVFGIFYAFAQQAVGLAVFIRRRCIRKQAFVGVDGKGMRAPFARVGIHTVQCADKGNCQFPPFGRIRVHVIKVLKIRRIVEIPVEGISVAFGDGAVFGTARRKNRCHQRRCGQ